MPQLQTTRNEQLVTVSHTERKFEAVTFLVTKLI